MKTIRRRAQNAQLRGVSGVGTVQNRGIGTASAVYSSNPFFSNNFVYRWQEWSRLYYTSWEAQKIIDIPVDDMFRAPFELQGLEDRDVKLIMDEFARLDVTKQLARAFKQERLLGGSMLLGVFEVPEDMDMTDELYLHRLGKGCLKAVNVVDVSRLSVDTVETDPFSPDYDRIRYYSIAGERVHCSRLISFVGNALYNRASQTMMQNFRYNPCGFGESKLTPLYDLLMRVVGTQEGAYHLVNMASVLLVECARIKSLQAVGSPAVEKLEEITEQLSMYRGAIIDGTDVKVSQHAASFGSVPELVLTFAQLLSAASDIPATRFLSQAPGGLNATGDADLQNYYNMIDSIRKTKLKSALGKLLDWTGTSIWGFEAWAEKKADLDIYFPPLWNNTETEQANIDNIYAQIVMQLLSMSVIDEATAAEIINARKMLPTKIETPEPLVIGKAEAEALGQMEA